ncbi:hypothetical protein M758_5G131400 [Ceratodon purpureus]|nr:hypothetical protein M758_5G131400 [Ceratodon purpureus]
MATALEQKRNNQLKERAVELEFQINRLGIQGRAYYEASQIKLRRNRMLIRAARTTNMLLHSALELLKQKELASRKESAGLDGVRKQAKILRAQFDAERAKAVYLQLDLQKQITETRSAEIDCADVLDPNTPIMEQIRLIDARLGAIFSKTKDTQVVELHFENLLKPMREERGIFASQIDSLTNVIDAKNHQLMQLRMVVFDGNKSRLQAKKELEELITIWFAGKRAEIGPDLQKRMLRQIRKIKMVMDVDSMRAMYSQFLFQQKQVAYLQEVKKELHTSLSQLRNTAEIPMAYQRRESLGISQVHSLADNTKKNVRRLSEFKPRKNSYPLELIVEGTAKLVDKLHYGCEGLADRGFTHQMDTLVKVQNRLILLLSQLNNKMNFLKELAEELKEAEKAKAAGLEPPPSKLMSKDDEKVNYLGHTKKTHEEILAEREEEEKKEAERARRAATPPKKSPY